MRCSSFLSTPSGWRATERRAALCPESRFLSTPSGWRATGWKAPCPQSFGFLSTPSGWRATKCTVSVFYRASGFLSTPSGWRATYIPLFGLSFNPDFYPRPPGGGRPTPRFQGDMFGDFYPRPPGGGRLDVAIDDRHRARISIHALRVEGDARGVACFCDTVRDFYPRPPGGGRHKTSTNNEFNT